MKRALMLLGLLLTIVTAACSDGNGPGNSPSPADSILTAIRAKYHVPGIAAVVISDARRIAVSTLGVRRLGYPAPITAHDFFHLGSDTKAMTATMIGTLVDEGKLSWETRPIDLFPEFAGSIDPGHVNITLADLLAHRAGIEPLTDFSVIPPLPGTPIDQRVTGTGLVLSLPPAAPSDSFLYSNGGYMVAAAMAERVMGKSWEQLMQGRVFGPMGITARFGWPAASDPNQPWGHDSTGSGFVPHDPNQAGDLALPPEAIAPAGNVSMSLLDFAAFAQLHLRGLRGQPAIVAESTFVRLHTPRGIYALGWNEISLNGEPTATHDGSTGTFYATMVLQPGKNVGVVVVINAGGSQAAAATAEAALTLLGRYGGVSPLPGSVAQLKAIR